MTVEYDRIQDVMKQFDGWLRGVEESLERVRPYTCDLLKLKEDEISHLVRIKRFLYLSVRLLFVFHAGILYHMHIIETLCLHSCLRLVCVTGCFWYSVRKKATVDEAVL